MQCSSVNQAHPPGNCTFPHSTCNHASRSAAFFPVFMLLLFKFVISNSPKIGNLALTFPIACGKLINADEAACLISLDADIAQLVERLIRNHQVKGSSPFIGSIFYRGVAQFGSAFGSGPKGRRFKSCHLDHAEALAKGLFSLIFLRFLRFSRRIAQMRFAVLFPCFPVVLLMNLLTKTATETSAAIFDFCLFFPVSHLLQAVIAQVVKRRAQAAFERAGRVQIGFQQALIFLPEAAGQP